MSVDVKKIGLREIGYIIGLVFSLSGIYYTLDNRISNLEKEQIGLNKKLDEVQKLTKTIYLGLIASGAIKPPSN